MPALAIDNAGDNIFVALENSTFPVYGVAVTTDLSTWSVAYNPGAGTAGNVTAGGDDTMIFYGNFGTDVTIIKHTISTVGNVDISPSSLGAKIINTLIVNPSNPDEMVCTVDTDQDILHTTDAGTTWTAWDAALGFDATALFTLWSGQYFLHRYLVGGEVGAGDLDVLYSPNEGASSQNKEGVALGLLGEVSGIETVES